MKREKIRFYFNEGLSDFLLKYDFKYKKIADTEVFIYETDNEYNCIYYRVVDMRLGVLKRIEEIEAYLNFFIQKYKLNYSNFESTISAPVSLIKKQTPPIIDTEIISEQIAFEVLEEFKKDIINYAFPFFDKYSTLPALDWLFNNYKDIYPDMFFGDPVFRFKRMIVAKLCNNPQYEIISEEVRQLCERSAAKKNGMDYYPSLWQDIYDHLKTVEPKYDYLKEM